MAELRVPELDLSVLGQLPQIYRKTQQDEQTRLALANLGQGASGNDLNAVALNLARMGNVQGAGQIAALSKNLAAPESTDEIKEYNLARQQGFQGSFFDFKTKLKQAGATRINNSVTTGENEYAKAIGKSDAERFIGYQKGGQAAQTALQSLDVLDKAMADPNFYSGPGAERFALPLRQAQAAFGGDPKAAASMEAFRATASKAALDAMGGSLGSGFSNADRDFVLNQVPNLQNTPEGNKQLIEVARKVRQREIEIARMAREYAARNRGRLDAGFDAELAAYAEKNPLFKNAPRQSAPASANTSAPVQNGNRTGTGVPWRIVQ